MNQFLFDSNTVDCNCMGTTSKNSNKLFLTRKKQEIDQPDFEPRRSAKSTEVKNQPDLNKNVKKSLRKQRPTSHTQTEMNYIQPPPPQIAKPIQHLRYQAVNIGSKVEFKRELGRQFKQPIIILQKPPSTLTKIREYHRVKPVINQMPFPNQIVNPFQINQIQPKYVPMNPVLREQRVTISHRESTQKLAPQSNPFHIQGFDKAVKNFQNNPTPKISLSRRSSLTNAKDPLSAKRNHFQQPQPQPINLRLAYSEDGSESADSQVIGKDFGDHLKDLKDFVGAEKCSYLYDQTFGDHGQTQQTSSSNVKTSQVKRSSGLIQNIAQFGFHAHHQKSYQNFHQPTNHHF